MTRQLDVISMPQAEVRTPVLAVRLGRGRTGGTTFLDLLIQRAKAGGREVIAADGDKSNPTLKGLYPDAMQPETGETPDVKDWIGTVLDRMATEQTSVALDLGGGDRVLAEYGRDLDVPGFCRAVGVRAVPIYFLGPEKDDLDHVWSIWSRGYLRSESSLLVMNEALVQHGRQTAATAFGPTLNSPEFKKMAADGARPIFMKALSCMTKVRERGVGLFDAANALLGGPLGPSAGFQVRAWLADVEAQIEKVGAGEWLP